MGFENIVTGFWMDYGQPPFLRARLTLTTNQSNLLLIALAILTTLTGEYLWQIFCQLLFLRRATNEPRDGLFHQTQLFLRNDDSPGEFSWNMLRLSMAWGKRRNTFRWRALRWTIFGLVMLTLNNTSSFWLPVLSNEGEVLFRSQPATTNWTLAKFPDRKTQDAVLAKYFQEINLAQTSESSAWLTYAASCYPDLNSDTSFGTLGSNMCHFYVQPYLNSTISFPGICPFAQDLCAVPLDQVIRVDSGRINSHDHMGINTPPDARVEYQTSITCSPIRTEGYVSPNYTNHNGVNDTLLYYYGDNWESNPDDDIDQDYEYTADKGTNISYYYTKAREMGKELPIALWAATEDRINSQFLVPSFNLSSNLRTSDAPVTILFLSNRLALSTPNHDPWFNNTQPLLSITANMTDNDQLYGAYKPVSPLGCVQTHTFCNPSTDKCVEHNVVRTPRLGADYGPLWDALGFNHQQRVVANFTTYVSRASSIGELTLDATHGSRLLLIYRMFGVDDPSFVEIDDTHWQHEVQNLMNLALSKVQGMVMSLTEAPIPSALEWGVVVPWTPDEQYLNPRVKVRSHSYQSFSVAALGLVIILQGLVILAGLYMQFVWPWLRLRKPDDSPDHNRAYKMWQLMGSVQLHRCLHQLLGRGRWRGAWHQVPTTDPRSLFCEYEKLPWQPYVNAEQEQALAEHSNRAEADKTFPTDVKEKAEKICESPEDGSSSNTLKQA